MIISKGEKVHVIYRRSFDTDLRRHFFGEIMEENGTKVRLKGKAVIFDSSKNEFVKKPETRVTIIDLSESGYIVNFIDKNVDLDDLNYVLDKTKRLSLTDNKSFSMDINEFGLNR